MIMGGPYKLKQAITLWHVKIDFSIFFLNKLLFLTAFRGNYVDYQIWTERKSRQLH